MEVPDNGMMQLVPARHEIHFRAVDGIGPKIEESFDALHAGR